MASKEFNTRIRLKRDTSANWTSANPVLLNGEKIVVDTASGETRYKVGDGVKHYSELPFDDEIIRGSITTAQTTASAAMEKVDAVQSDVEEVQKNMWDGAISKKEKEVYCYPAENTELHIVSHISAAYESDTKNIMPVSKWGSEWNGITYTWNSDSSLTISGTATADGSSYELVSISSPLILKEGIYTFSAGVILPDGISIYGDAYEDASTWTGFSDKNSFVVYKDDAAVFSAAGNHEYAIAIRVEANCAVNTTIYPQIEAGEYATAYEPYVASADKTVDSITLSITNGSETSQYNVSFDTGVQNAEYDWATGTLTDLDSGTEHAYTPCTIKALSGMNVISADAGAVDVFGYNKDGQSAKMQKYSHIPRMYLYGDTSEMTKDNAVMLRFRYEGAENYINDSVDSGLRENGKKRGGWVKVKWQGSSSIRFPKKNYTFTFYWDENGENKRSIPFLSNWGAQSKYCAKANFIDPTHCRNVVAAKLWSECVRSRNTTSESYIRMNTLPNAGAIDGYPMLVFINDKYQGIYTMNIPKDEWMFGMKDGEGTNVVLCGEDYSDSARFHGAPAIDGTDWGYEVEPADKSWVLGSFGAIYNAIIMPESTAEEKAAKKAAIEQCVDIYSVIDYTIFIDKLGLSDNNGKNQLMVTYDGVKWMISAYDLDTAFDNHWSGAKYHPSNNSTDYGNNLTHTIKNLYSDVYEARKAELVNGCLSKANITDKLMNFAIDIPQEAYRAEAELWPDMCGANSIAIQQIVNSIADDVDKEAIQSTIAGSTDNMLSETSINPVQNKIVAAAINEIQSALGGFGGRNLIRNSAKMTGDYWDVVTQTDKLYCEEKGSGVYKWNIVNEGEADYTWTSVGTKCGDVADPYLHPGDVLTFSVWYYVDSTKAAVDHSIYIELQGVGTDGWAIRGVNKNVWPNEIVTDRWTKVSLTYTVQGDDELIPRCSFGLAKNGNVAFAYPKLERGVVITDWSLAPEDILITNAMTASELEDLSDLIV